MPGTAVEPQPPYVRSFPVCVVDIPNSGRGLCATRSLKAGDLALCAERMGHAVRVKTDQFFCARCLRHRLPQEAPPLSTSCSRCQAVWICDECNSSDFWAFHAPACDALKASRSKKSLKTEERKLLRFLIAVVSQHWAQTAGNVVFQSKQQDEEAGGAVMPQQTPIEAGAVDTDSSRHHHPLASEKGQGSSEQETDDDNLDCSDHEQNKLQPHACTLDDFLLMQRGPQDKRTMMLFRRVAAMFLESVGPELRGSLRTHAETDDETRDLLVEILLRDRVNVFNLADAEGEEAGEMHFPAAAMLNHSCVPNVEARLVRGKLRVIALHDIAAGGELYHAYVPLTVSDSKRKEMLRECWLFECRCLRCRQPTHPMVQHFDQQFLCDCGGASLDVVRETNCSTTVTGEEIPLQSHVRDADAEAGQEESAEASRKCTCNVHNLLPWSGTWESDGVQSDPSLRTGSARSRAGQRARGGARPEAC